VKDLLSLAFNIGASTVFTIGISGGNAFDAAFPSKKAAHHGCKSGRSHCENRSAAPPMKILRAAYSLH
jgi:hypothetical protein